MKNKGYYGWIHSLNEAAMQSQQNGIDMLAEQAARKGEMLTEAKKPNRSPEGIAAKRAREAADTVKRRENREAAAKAAAAAKSSGGGELSDFDFGGFQDRVAEVRAEKQASGSGVQRVETGFHGANDVDDSYDPTDPDSGTEEVPYGRLPSFPWARDSKPTDADQDGDADAQDVRLDASDNVIGDEEEPEDEGKYEIPTANWKSLKLESITSKISKMMNEGKKAVRGRIAKGDDSDVPSRTPNREGAPKGIFRGTESPSEKVGRILEIVRDGPEEHGEEKHSWAKSALETMQKQLRKD
jgi:hypothetical protein